MTTRFTMPRLVATQAMVAVIIGVKTNGIARVRLSTTGEPKISGSLMLKMAGAMPMRPRSLRYLDLQTVTRRIARPMVQPEPPIQMNHW